MTKSVSPTTKDSTNSQPFASISNQLFHKQQDQFCSVSASRPPLTRHPNPEYRSTYIWLGFSIVSGMFYLFARHKRIEAEQ